MFFDNVRTPKENLVGELHQGWTIVKGLLGFERLNIGSPRRPLEAMEKLEAELHAAIAIPQIKRADVIVRGRQHNVRSLNEKLEPFADIFQLPLYSDDVSYLAYPLVIRDARWSREKVMKALGEAGVETRPLFGCLPTQQPAYRFLKERYEGRLPHADFAGRNGFYLGCHQYLEKDHLDHVTEAFSALVRKGP